MKMPFRDRHEAGRFLASKLKKYRQDKDAVVLGLPRGGVVVAYEVAQALGLPLDVFVVRKLSVPYYPELAIGAIASGGAWVINQEVVNQIGLTSDDIEETVRQELAELERRERVYREGKPFDVKGKTVLLIDDGLATGSTMQAAVVALKKLGVQKLVVAVPVGASETCEAFKHEVDDAICAVEPEPFYAVGAWYKDFRPTTDEEVKTLLGSAMHAVNK